MHPLFLRNLPVVTEARILYLPCRALAWAAEALCPSLTLPRILLDSGKPRRALQ